LRVSRSSLGDLAFGLTIAPLHFYRIAERINVLVNGAGEPHDGRKVSFYRVVDPSRKRVCFAATHNAKKCMARCRIVVKAGEPSLRASTFLACPAVSFPLGSMQSAAEMTVPCFRISDWFKNWVLPDGPHLFLSFSSAPSGQEPLQI
jgi:hypothetical protein